MTSSTLLHASVTDQVLGSFFEVYRGHGFGFLETVYTNSMAIELGLRGLRVSREVPVRVHWKGVPVGTYRIDMLVQDAVLVEVKSIKGIGEVEERQLLNYLKATGIEVGMILNFGPEPQFRRRVLSKEPVELSAFRPRSPRAPR